MKKYCISSILLLIIAGIAFLSCSKSLDNSEDINNQKQYSVVIPASMASSKVVADGGTATFSTSEKVYVYNNTTSAFDTEYLSPDTEGATTNLRGILKGSYAQGNSLHLLYNTTSDGIADYTHQDGTLENVVDAATATVKITSVNGNSFTTRTAYFENLQSIFKFTFMEGSKIIKIKELQIYSIGNKLVQNYDVVNETPTYGSVIISNNRALGVVYAALRFSSNPSEAIIFSVKDENGITYTGVKNTPSSGFKTGRFYTATITLNKVEGGMLNRKFSVSADKTVYFAWGNLKREDGNYKLSNSQYDTDYYRASGTNTSPVYYDDEHSSTGWYQLTRDEWDYLINTRTMNDGVARWYRITSNGKTGNLFGLLLPPDGATSSELIGVSDGATDIDLDLYTTLSYVFLPAAGTYFTSPYWGTGTFYVGERGTYWTSTRLSNQNGYMLMFSKTDEPKANYSYGSDTHPRTTYRLVHD